MQWINGFITSITCVVMLTAACNALLPDGSISKFVRLVMGIIVTITLLGAITGLNEIDFDKVFAFDIEHAIGREALQATQEERVARHFAVNVARDVEMRIYDAFGYRITAEVSVRYDSEGRLSGIEGITIDASGGDKVRIMRKIADIYDVEEEQIIVSD